MDVPNPCWHASNQPGNRKHAPLSTLQVRQRPRRDWSFDAVTGYAASGPARRTADNFTVWWRHPTKVVWKGCDVS